MARGMKRRSFGASPKEHKKRLPRDIQAAESYFNQVSSAVKAQKCGLAMEVFAMAHQAVARARSEDYYGEAHDPKMYDLDRAEKGAYFAMEGCLKNMKLNGLGARRKSRR